MPSVNEAFEEGCRAFARGDYREAERCYSRVIADDPRWHDAWQRRAFSRDCLGNTRGAIADYRQSLRLDTRCAWCWGSLSDLYRKTQRYLKARACVIRAIRLRPSESSFRHDLGELHLKLGDYPKAIAAFESLRRSKGFGMLWREGRGRARALMGKTDRALHDLDACVRLRPDTAETWAYRALARLKAGDEKRAAKDWAKASRLGKALPRIAWTDSEAADRLLIG